MNQLVKKHLSTIGLHDETFDEYIAGIITDNSLEESEKREAISEFISGATDAPSESIIDDLFKTWIEFEEKIKETETEEKQEKEANERERREQLLENEDGEVQCKDRSETKEIDLLQASHSAANASTPELITISLRNSKKQLTKEERKKREQLLARYGYDLDEVVENEDGEAEVQYKDRSETKEINNDLLKANRNAEQVKQREQLQREQMKKQYEEEKEKNRRLLEQQQRNKEKAKRKTMKREKRSW